RGIRRRAGLKCMDEFDDKPGERGAKRKEEFQPDEFSRVELLRGLHESNPEMFRFFQVVAKAYNEDKACIILKGIESGDIIEAGRSGDHRLMEIQEAINGMAKAFGGFDPIPRLVIHTERSKLKCSGSNVNAFAGKDFIAI